MQMLTKFLSLSLLMLNMLSSAQATELPEASFFAGRWGVVSFNNEGDMMKMAGVARGYCGLPYTIINKGNGVFRMYVEDKLADVKIIDKGGKFFIVPTEEANGIHEGARKLNIINNNTFTLEYLQSDLNARYGKNVFARCGR